MNNSRLDRIEKQLESLSDFVANRFTDINGNIELVIKLLRQSQPTGVRGFLVVGQEIETMSFTLVIGAAAKTATAQFVDGSTPPVARPIFSAVWSVDETAALSFGTQTDNLTGGSSSIPITGVAVGAVNITCTAECDPVAGKNTVKATLDGAVMAPEDVAGTITVT